MKDWTYADQMNFESDLKDEFYDEYRYRKQGSNLYVLDSNYIDFKEVDDEFCDSFFQEI